MCPHMHMHMYMYGGMLFVHVHVHVHVHVMYGHHMCMNISGARMHTPTPRALFTLFTRSALFLDGRGWGSYMLT